MINRKWNVNAFKFNFPPNHTDTVMLMVVVTDGGTQCTVRGRKELRNSEEKEMKKKKKYKILQRKWSEKHLLYFEKKKKKIKKTNKLLLIFSYMCT